jgi:hypothetical protein
METGKKFQIKYHHSKPFKNFEKSKADIKEYLETFKKQEIGKR